MKAYFLITILSSCFILAEEKEPKQHPCVMKNKETGSVATFITTKEQCEAWKQQQKNSHTVEWCDEKNNAQLCNDKK